MKKKKDISDIKNIKDFANELLLTPATIEKLTRDNHNYYQFKIPKGNSGKTRLITAPKGKLKVIQKWILLNVLEQYYISDSAMAFIKGKHGIKENALAHFENRYVLQFDLKDFFPNIKFYQVYNLFSHMDVLDEKMALLFAKLCTYQKRLPQGAITSPCISNLMCLSLDARLAILCDEYDVVYTRYADDLTFSSDCLSLLFMLMKEICKIIKGCGFKVNYDKTKILTPSKKQAVTGITINDGVLKADKKLKRLVRARLYYGIKNDYIDEYDKVLGYISFIDSIEENYKDKLYRYVRDLLVRFGRQDSWGLLKFLHKIDD